MTALMRGLTRSTRVMASSSSSEGDTSRRRTSAARSSPSNLSYSLIVAMRSLAIRRLETALDERPRKMNDYSFMPRTRTDDKRQRILDAAVRVFARKGYFASRVSDVAKAAGIADGTIYLYFQNKDDVLVSLFDEIMSEHVEAGRREVGNI